MKRFIFLLFLAGVVLSIYCFNSYTNGWLFYYVKMFPHIIALIVSVIFIAFPRDYDRIPNILFGNYIGIDNSNNKRDG